jgi:hypothetical protein
MTLLAALIGSTGGPSEVEAKTWGERPPKMGLTNALFVTSTALMTKRAKGRCD